MQLTGPGLLQTLPQRQRQLVGTVQFGKDKSNQPPSMESRFMGAILGLAVGDALGCNLETMTARAIRKKYGVHRDITGGQATPKFYTWPKGAVTDDTQMTLLILDSLLKHPEGNLWDMRDRFVQWMKPNPPGTGKLTRLALALAEQLDPKKDDIGAAAEQAYIQLKKASNGGLMRCSPIGLLYQNKPDKLLALSKDSCRITHAAPECQASAMAYNWILAGILRNPPKNRKAVLGLYGEAANQIALLSPETAQAIRQAPALHKRDLKTTSGTLDTLQVALWAFYRFRDMEDALVTVVNLGGDTDTNGAVTGALFGARLGDSAIPTRWRNALLQEQAIGDRAKALYKLYQQHG